MQVSSMCCDAFRKLFKQDKVGVASLAAVRVISGLVKSLSYSMKPEVETRHAGRVGAAVCDVRLRSCELPPRC